MLQVEHVTVTYEGVPTLADVSLDVPNGTVVAVLGPSGAGKTTLLRTIAGLETSDRGTIAWDGQILDDTPPHARGFGLMFQDYALFPHMTVGENVAFGIADRPDRDRRVAEVLDWVGLAGYESRSVGHLSGGEQQRVALARSLAPAPRLLMLDEPVGSLDRTLRDRIVPELRDLFVTHSITALYVTHDQEEAFAIADRIAILRDGRIAQVGAPEEVWKHPADAWVARFLGFTNIVEIEVADGVAAAPWGSFPVPKLGDGKHEIVIPPNAVTPGGSLSGRAVTRSFRGGHYRVQLRLPDGSLLDTEVDEAPAVGSTMAFSIDPTRLVPL